MYPNLELYPARPTMTQDDDMMDLVSMFQRADLRGEDISTTRSEDGHSMDISMTDEPHFPSVSPPSASHPLPLSHPPSVDVSALAGGCAYLEAIGVQLSSRLLASDEHLDVLYTHRTLFAVHPSGHVHCAPALNALAGALEARGDEMDRRAGEAFRHEATVMVGCHWGSGMQRD